MRVDPIYIQEPWHTIWQALIRFNFQVSYRRLTYSGLENIPTDGAVILSPNHCNCLCDALAIIAMDRRPKVFAARADIFRNPRIARLLRFHRIMPIRRLRDGLDEVRHNDETIHEAVDTLLHDTFFCMMPEGRHRTMHSLLPLSKGIFRIAIDTASQTDRPVYIVPVGLEYGDYFHLWDSLRVQIGKPICVSDYLNEHTDLSQPQQILALREQLTERMRQLILWVPDDEHYEQNWAQLRAEQGLDQKSAWDIPFLVALAPLTAVCALITLPYSLSALLIRRKVKDPAFYNSVQVVIQLLLMILSVGLLILPWQLCSEWMFRLRRIRKS